MKKLLALILAAALALSMTACGGDAADTKTPSDAEDINATDGAEETAQEEEPQLSELALAAIFATKEVKSYLDDNLKNPQRLAINSIKGGVTEDINFIFEIDYSAQNGFGGSNREQLYITVTKSETSISGYGILNYVDRTFSGSSNQSYTKIFYNELAANGELMFSMVEEGTVETLLINPEDLAGAGIVSFDVDVILSNI